MSDGLWTIFGNLLIFAWFGLIVLPFVVVSMIGSWREERKRQERKRLANLEE